MHDLECLSETCRNGSVTARVSVKDASNKAAHPRQIYLHSKYNPEKEASSFAEQYTLRPDTTVFLFGLGYGYQADIFLRKMGSGNTLIILEPDESIVSVATRVRDLSFLRDDRVQITIMGDKKQNTTLFTEHLDMTTIDNALLICLPAYKEIFPQAYKHISALFEETRVKLTLEKNTIVNQGLIWQQNLTSNLPALWDSIGVSSFIDKWAGRPAVIVSSGPSLDHNIDTLKLFKDKALVIAAYSSLKALTSHGFTPDIVASVESRQLMYETPDEIKTPLSIPLLYTLNTDQRLIQKHNGPKIAFFSIRDEFSKYLALRYHKENNLLLVGGSIVCSVMDFAALCGCDPVIFVGQDLAYAEAQTHAQGTAHDRLRLLGQNKKADALVEDIYGNMIPTDSRLIGYLHWMEKYIAQDHRKYIDATEGGAMIHGTELMTLRKAAERYAANDSRHIIKASLAGEKLFSPSEKRSVEQHLAYCQHSYRRLCELILQGLSIAKQMHTCWMADKILDISQKTQLDMIEKQIHTVNEQTSFFDLVFKRAVCVYQNKRVDFNSSEPPERDLQEKALLFQIMENHFNLSTNKIE